MAVAKQGRGGIAASALTLAVMSALGAAAGEARGQLYWDANGAAPGAGTAPFGTWGSDSYWSTDPLGQVATGPYAAGSGGVVFSAGADATGPWTLDVSGTQSADGVRVEEGTISLFSGTVDTGGGAFRIDAGATVIANAAGRFNAGGQIVLDGGTLSVRNTTNNQPALPAGKLLEITSSGGAISYDDGNPAASLATLMTTEILGAGGTPTAGVGTLTKTGPDEWRVQGPSVAGFTFQKLRVVQGLYRIGSTGTPAGATAENGFGADPAAELTDAITLDGGAIGVNLSLSLNANRGITVGPAGGTIVTAPGFVMTVPGRLSGSGTLTVSSGASSGGSVTLSNDNNATSFTGALVVTGATLTLNRSLNATHFSGGTGGTVNIAAGQTFTVGAGGADTTYGGRVDGTGSFVKTGAGVLTLSSTTAWGFSGGVHINAGTLRIAPGASAINGKTVVTIDGPGVFDLNGNDQFITGLAGTGAVLNNNGPGGLRILGDSSLTFNGTIAGSAPVSIAQSSGSQTLGGNNVNLGGGVVLQRGGLSVGHRNALGTAPLTVAPTSATPPTLLQAATPLTGADAIPNNINISRVTVSGTPLFTLQLGGSNDFALAGVIANASPAAPGAIRKVDAGAVTLSGANTYTGGTIVDAGTLVAANGDAFAGGNLTVNGATAGAQPGLAKALTVNALAFTGAGKLDLTDNALVIKSSSLGTVRAQVTAGYNNGTWDGGGITSSAAANDPNFDTTLGFFDNAEVQLPSFEGVTLTGPEIVVKYTYYGDADLTGVVDTDDFQLFLAGYQDSTLPRTWFYGDFDYTGVIDTDDFQVFLYGYQNQGGPLSVLSEAVAAAQGLSFADRALMQAAIAAVPEPTSLGLLVLAGLGVCCRPERHRRNGRGR